MRFGDSIRRLPSQTDNKSFNLPDINASMLDHAQDRTYDNATQVQIKICQPPNTHNNVEYLVAQKACLKLHCNAPVCGVKCEV